MENDKHNRNVEPAVSFDKLSDMASIQQEMETAPSDTIKVALPILKSNGSNISSPNPLYSRNENEVMKNSTPKVSKKKVRFPEAIIVGYHEPALPWNNVSECSTEDLVAAYKKSCLKHDVKPLPKLLQQLHAVANFHERNETLTFRGESLNIRHCEALEEVLRRVQYRTIDLEASHLDEESAIAMFDMIEYYHSATRINISYNKIGLRGWQACSRMLKKTHCVEHLDARSCALTEQMVPIFGRALRLGSVLKVLHLENSIMSGRSLMILVAAIKMNEILEDLFLADNKLMPSDGIQLGNLLKFNHKLRLLDVRNNHLGDVGTSHLSEGLYEQNLDTGLQTLVLWNNQVTCQSMHALSRALKSNQNLQTLNLGHNNITNEGIHRLKEGLLQNKSLLRIGLQAAKVYCEGAVALAECIAESLILIRLDLRENDIKTAGLMALSLALKVNESVHRIDIDQNSKRESGVKDFADQQRRLLQDISTYSQRNRDAAVRQEQEEKQRKLEEELQAALTECDPIAERLTSDAPKSTEASQACNPGTPDINNTQLDTEDSLAKPGQETPDQQLMRLQLNLPLFSRSQSLDSPADPPQQKDSPATAHVKEQEVVADPAKLEESPIPVEFPPSPMVSSEGKTIHADTSACPAIPLLMEPSISIGQNLQETPNLATPPQVEETSGDGKSAHQGSNTTYNLSPSYDTPPTGGTLRPSKPQSPTRSPTSRRKFTISRVVEHSTESSPSSSAAHPVLSDSAVTTLLNTTKEQHHQQQYPMDDGSPVSDKPTVKASCDSVGDVRHSGRQQDVYNDVTEFIGSMVNNVMNIALDSVTEKVKTSDDESQDHVVNSLESQSPTVSVILSTGHDALENVHRKNGASLGSVSPTVDCVQRSGVTVGDSGDDAIGYGIEAAVNRHVTELSGASEIKDIDPTSASAGYSGETKVVTDSVNINGINVSVEDVQEMSSEPKETGSDKGEEGLGQDLLSNAEDFEKELDEMIASVQTGLAFTSPEAVQTDNST